MLIDREPVGRVVLCDIIRYFLRLLEFVQDLSLGRTDDSPAWDIDVGWLSPKSVGVIVAITPVTPEKSARALFREVAPRPLYEVALGIREGWRNLVRSYYSGRKIRRRVQGINFELDLVETIDSSIYFDGFYERTTTRAMAACVRDGMTVFDVGANIGAHTLRLCRLAGRGRVFAFEPTSWAFGKLSRNLSLNNFPNCRIEHLALSDSPGEEVIHRGTDRALAPFRASFQQKGRSATANTSETIRFDTLDHFVEQHEIGSIDFIKIDVDGYEGRVVRGGLSTIERDRPLMCIEFSHEQMLRIGDSLPSLLETLQDVGYGIYDIEAFERCSIDRVLEILQGARALDFLLSCD